MLYPFHFIPLEMEEAGFVPHYNKKSTKKASFKQKLASNVCCTNVEKRKRKAEQNDVDLRVLEPERKKTRRQLAMENNKNKKDK